VYADRVRWYVYYGCGGPIPGMGPGIPDPDGAGYTNASFVCT